MVSFLPDGSRIVTAAAAAAVAGCTTGPIQIHDVLLQQLLLLL